jgi:prophage maintenance system killer protein
MAISKLSIKGIEYIAFRLAQELMSFNEPIPDFSTRLPNILESCLNLPFQSAFGKSLYRRLLPKGSILFYLMIKNHPFQNGNKRIAITTLFVFLHKNGKWLKVDTQELYNFTVWIAQSPSKLKDETVRAIEKFLRLNIIDS